MADSIKNGGPAFPGYDPNSANRGMSLRDWFAGQAIEGLVGRYGGMMVERTTDLAYQIADEAIQRRKETPEAAAKRRAAIYTPPTETAERAEPPSKY